MNKKELIAYKTKEHNKVIKAIEALPDVPDELGYEYSSPWSDPKINKKIQATDLSLELHKMRDILGDYKIDTYWIPYNGLVCVTYMFGKTKVWFMIETDDEQSIISMLSGGKCSVVEKTSKSVECKV